MDDQFYMGEALKEAREAFDKGEVPVGVVIVYKDRIIARAHNQVEMLKDATAHAEMIGITQASSTLDNWRLDDVTIYLTKEPCPMCAGAMVNSRVKRLVYGCIDGSMGAAGSVMNIAVYPNLRHRLDVIGGIKERECREILQEFFSNLRGRVAESG